jgi:hypothetical protein
VGLFKSMKDLAEVTKSAQQMKDQQQKDAGYKPGLAGGMAQMGDMLGDMNEQLKELGGDSAEREKILTEGIAAQGVIVGMGTPARGASWFNLDIDLEVHVPGRAAYRVANQYMVPASATLGPGVSLPIKVDSEDQAKIAIDWDSAAKPPERGEVRPADGSSAPPPAASDDAGSGDTVADLERLAKLHDSGALTDAEFEQQKARILGS